MQAVILAGGLGTRLWPLTREIPKAMVPIHGVPYLEYQLRFLARQSITNVVLLTGYLGEQVESYFGTGEWLGMSIQYSRETKPLGTGGALREASALLQESILLLYGDSFLPIDYRNVMTALDRRAAQVAVAVYDSRLTDTNVIANISLDAEGHVVRYDKNAIDDPELVYVEAGVLALRRSVIDSIPPGNVSLEQQIFPRLIAANQLVALVTPQRFYDIGTPARLETIAKFLTHDYHSNSVSH